MADERAGTKCPDCEGNGQGFYESWDVILGEPITVHESCRNPRCVDGVLTERKDAERVCE
jgi:hypothetical protein